MAAKNGSHRDRPDEGGKHAPALLDSFAPGSPPETVRALAFWSAVVLPFLHVPLLTTGLSTPGERQAFAVLLALNAAALYAGHSYRE